MTPDNVTAVDRPAASTLPSDALIVLPVRSFVLFPEMVFPITLARPSSVAAAQQAAREQRQVVILLQRDPAKEEPGPDDLHRIGTVANILRYVTTPDGNHHLVCQGVQRFSVTDFVEGHPFLMARGLHLVEPTASGADMEARFLVLQQQVREVLDLLPQVPAELRQTVEATEQPGALADLAATYLDAKPEDKQDILETVDLASRLNKVSRLLANRLEVLRLSKEIGQQTKASLDARQREILLREQMAAIQRELGDDSSGKQELADLEKAIAEAKMPAEVETAARKELRRLQRTPEASAEHGIIRTYLDTLIELPWASPEPKPIDIAEARRVLDADHFGLEKIKLRIVEYLAVRKLAPEGKAPILCFVGPPGVGKTSLGQSIARAMGRKFARVSLGGLHDEAEIRGHRRTYIGAMPGNIIQAIRKAGTRDCVLMLDEIDKMGSGVHGDPSAAMLEVLDPEQNGTFRDNYLDVPFDLSRIVFIATANMLETVPGPLRDRMEIISLTGYTAGEKLQIARRYLVRRQLEANGLKPEQIEVDDTALRRIIEGYTREAGVRSLEREIGRTLRRVAVQVAEGSAARVVLDTAEVEKILGAPRFENEVAQRTSVPGVATGLAWTPVG
ncbi:MAG: endopeptidase La, partial [Alphaproteobacteria bacterium]|nr:endopeptidase La [Alphaproteobacteria bacterium]